MMAAIRAGGLGERVLLLEKNNRLGKKLSITGGGRCNILNAQFDTRLFLENFPEARQFLFSPFSQFGVQEAWNFFNDNGLPLMVEERNRAFPVSQSAEDVCDFLERLMDDSRNVTVRLSCAFSSFILEDKVLRGVKTECGEFFARRVILASGGFAAPETGSTGEGVVSLRDLGHTVNEPNASLVPLASPARFVHRLAGYTVENADLRFFQDGRAFHKVSGRVLFTHFGISGPIVINSAYIVKKRFGNGRIEASLDLFPRLDFDKLDKVVVGILARGPRKLLDNVLKEIVSGKLRGEILRMVFGDFDEIVAGDLGREDRRALVHILKDFRFPISGTMGLDRSIVADGGVDVREVDFRTMESRIMPGLYLIGDVLDINRPSGGYSLQLCWTTGYLSGGAKPPDLPRFT